MSKPKTLSLIGKRHRVRWGVDGLKDDDGNDAYGLFDSSQKIISIAAGQTHDDERETVLHEILHALEVQMDAKIPERCVTQLAVGLYAALKDNPKLVTYLLESEEDDADHVGNDQGSGGDQRGSGGGSHGPVLRNP